MDIHDCPEISKSLRLEENMAITIEPGIYINENNTTVQPKYRGIGIRIEDDIVITDNSCSVLSEMCPKEMDEIEKILNK
jgi:Xaa-Pro aminopeptidase